MKAWFPVRIGSIVLALLFCFGLDMFVGGNFNDYIYRLFVLAGLYVTLAVSLNLINGITGQFSIGHAAFYQVGAYSAGYVSIQFFSKQPLSGPMWLVLMAVVGAAVAAIAGLIVGLPSLRLKGDYLAIVTLGFGEIIRIVTNNMPAIGGSYGMNVQPKMNALWLVWLLAIVCIAVCRNLLKSAHGLPFLAVREDEVASSAMGVNLTSTKVTAFILGSAFAGAAGAILAHYEGFINPDSFKMDVSFLILTMVVLGGTGSITGSTIAALILFAIPESPRFLVDSKGQPLIMNFGQLLSGSICIIGAVLIIKWLMENYHGERRTKSLYMLAAVIGGIILMPLLGMGLSAIPFLAAKQWEIKELRMVILAVSLIVLMLLRPQGIFAHHEFSWSWVKRLFNKEPKEATS